MNKEEFTKRIETLLHIVKTGSPAEVKQAQREIARFYNAESNLHGKRARARWDIFVEELKTFDEIKDVDHQVYFINTLKWSIRKVGKDHFADFSSFLLRCVEHPSGKIRRGAVRALDWLSMTIVPLEYDRSWMKKNPDSKTLASIKHNRKLFGEMVLRARKIAKQNFEKNFQRYKYVDALPPSIYKSAQQLLVDVLLCNEDQEKVFELFLKETQTALSEDSQMLWGETRPYSEINIVLNTRILDNSVARVMIEVRGNINPTTFNIVKQNIKRFADDQVVLSLIDTAQYAGKMDGYLVSAGAEEFGGDESFERAWEKLRCTQAAIIRMHEFAMDHLDIKRDN